MNTFAGCGPCIDRDGITNPKLVSRFAKRLREFFTEKVDGKPAALRTAFNGWKADIQQARAVLAKITAPNPFKP